MRIGIVTFFYSNDNYGQILQAYALYKYLENKGHDCFIINYSEYNPPKFIPRVINIFRYAFSPKKFKLFLNRKVMRKPAKLNGCKDERMFSNFRNEKMRFSKVYSYKELIEYPPFADAYVCGSDQIWGGLDPVMYLSFVPKKIKKIAFAPSFGGVKFDFYGKYKIKKHLKSFNLVSCRENDGVDLCKSLGRYDAKLFPDPTLLHSSEFYDKLVIEKIERKPYVFVYLLGNEMDFNTSQIIDFANTNNLDIVCVTGQNGSFEELTPIPFTIEQWIDGVKNAEYIITNSFHGTVFSIIFHKKFITIPLSGVHSRMNARIEVILNKYNLKNCIYRGNLDELFNEPDFTNFDFTQKNEFELVDNIIDSFLR